LPPERLEQVPPARRGAVQPLAADMLLMQQHPIWRRIKLGVVMIKCPETGRAIPTGMKAERKKFRCSTVFFARTYCAICRVSHEWFAKEAWVYEPEERLRKAS
jgi:hypothetical protein